MITPIRPTLASVKAAARIQGATVDESTIRAQFVNVDAPDRMVWVASGTHALLVSWDTPGTSYGGRSDPKEKRDAIADVMERMASGLTPCEEPECDACNP